MNNRELLKKYIEKKTEYLGLIYLSGILVASNDKEQLEEVEKQAEEVYKDMSYISMAFIESFIILHTT